MVKPLFTPNFVDIHPIGTHKHIGLVYFAISSTNEITLAAEEHNQIKWFTKEELNDPANAVRNDIIWYATKAFEKATQAQ